jgi:hypothetical protein
MQTMKRWTLFLLGAALVSWVAGCGKSPDPAPAPGPKPNAAEKKPHSHGSGPHGGALTDWGGGAYHVEFAPDHGTKEATVYILGSDEKSPAPIKTDKVHVVIKPLDGEKDGKSSRFVGKHDTIGIVREFAGTVSGVVEGTPYAGDFKEEPHDDGKK